LFHDGLFTFEARAQHLEFLLLGLNLTVTGARVARAVRLFFLCHTLIKLVGTAGYERERKYQ
jgi:hypothetical protein